MSISGYIIFCYYTVIVNDLLTFVLTLSDSAVGDPVTVVPDEGADLASFTSLTPGAWDLISITRLCAKIITALSPLNARIINKFHKQQDFSLHDQWDCHLMEGIGDTDLETGVFSFNSLYSGSLKRT